MPTLGSLMGQTLASLWRNKLRSVLTMFGISWGVASFVLMSGLCDSFRLGQRQNMSQLGDNIVLVFGGKTERQAVGQRSDRRVRLSERDVMAIREHCPAVGLVAGEVKKYDTPASSRFNSGQFLVLGASPEYLRLRNLPVESGRQVSAADVDQSRRVCVLGASVRKQLFEHRSDILGREVRINDYPYRVIGLLSEKQQTNSYDGWDNDKILIPASTLKRDCPPDRETYEQGRLNNMVYRPVSVATWREAQSQVRLVLGLIHNFDPDDEGAIVYSDSIEAAERFDNVFDATEVFLVIISIVTLSLGGVGVMNTMLSAVSERTQEIGLKKALGATRSRILLDFLLEGLFLAMFSGLAGLSLTALAAAAINSLPMPDMVGGLPIKMDTALFAIAALGTVAVAASLPPAWRAAQLTPVEALREEK